jgi:hypothetical protein
MIEKTRKNKENDMEKQYYTVARIEGEYAYLRPDNGAEDLFIAMALLPLGVDEGDRLVYEFPDYTILH